MLAPIELPGYVDDLDRGAHELAARLRAALGPCGERRCLAAGDDLLAGLPEGYLFLVDGFVALQRDATILRYFDAGLWLETAAWAGGVRLTSEFDTHTEFFPSESFLGALLASPDQMRRWLAYERCQQQILAGICGELSTPEPDVRTGLTRVAAGDLIVAQGERLDQLLVLVDGEAQAESRGVVLGAVNSAEFIGEIGFLTGTGCGADVRALTDCLVQTIPRDAFELIARSRPEMVLQMAKTLAERLSRANARQVGVARAG